MPVLTVREVSMVDGHLFDTLAKLAVELRKKTDRPFGGIQVGPISTLRVHRI